MPFAGAGNNGIVSTDSPKECAPRECGGSLFGRNPALALLRATPVRRWHQRLRRRRAGAGSARRAHIA